MRGSKCSLSITMQGASFNMRALHPITPPPLPTLSSGPPNKDTVLARTSATGTRTPVARTRAEHHACKENTTGTRARVARTTAERRVREESRAPCSRQTATGARTRVARMKAELRVRKSFRHRDTRPQVARMRTEHLAKHSHRGRPDESQVPCSPETATGTRNRVARMTAEHHARKNRHWDSNPGRSDDSRASRSLKVHQRGPNPGRSDECQVPCPQKTTTGTRTRVARMAAEHRGLAPGSPR